MTIRTLFAIDPVPFDSSQKSVMEVEQFQSIREQKQETKESAAWPVRLSSLRHRGRLSFLLVEHKLRLETIAASLRD